MCSLQRGCDNDYWIRSYIKYVKTENNKLDNINKRVKIRKCLIANTKIDNNLGQIECRNKYQIWKRYLNAIIKKFAKYIAKWKLKGVLSFIR